MADPVNHHHKRLVSGAGYVFLGRLGAIIEAFSIVAFTWAYGASIFGVFAVLWSYVKVLSGICDLAMTTALQRYVPKHDQQETTTKAAIARFAILFCVIFSSIIALFIFWMAADIAQYIHTDPEYSAELTALIRIYCWVLPMWTLVEVSTAAIRATRRFGPEIKIRIFYEQIFRLIAAMGFAALGYLVSGLFWAHLISTMLAAMLSLRLVYGLYGRAVVFGPGLPISQMIDITLYGLSVMPANLSKKLFSELPVMLLNMLLPGAAGALAAAYYAVARKIASVLQLVRLTFEYVLSPLASEAAGRDDKQALNSMYAYATRLSVSLAVPLAVALVMATSDILHVFRPEFAAASIAIVILCVARAFEAMLGPSSAIIEMLGHKLLPALNSLTGIMAMIILSFILIPDQGLAGAAIAAGIGINITALLSLIEATILYGYNPYGKKFLRPLGTVMAISALFLMPAIIGHGFPVPFGLVYAIIGLMLTLVVIMRFGMDRQDIAPLSAPLGRLGAWIKGKSNV